MTITKRLIGLLVFFAFSSALGTEEGELAPDFTLPSIYENQPVINLGNLKGKTVYIDFWLLGVRRASDQCPSITISTVDTKIKALRSSLSMSITQSKTA